MGTRRTIVIGDVHGCHRELQDLLVKVKYDPADRLIFVGDLINKGPDTVGVLQTVKDLGAEVIQGNHEIGFLRRIDRGDDHPLIGQMGASLQYWIDWIRTWPLYIEDPEFLVVHAGLAPGMRPELAPTELITKIRTWDGTGQDLQNPGNPPWYEFYTGDRLIVFGHWAARGLVVRKNVIGLDTGCVYGKSLSAVILPERKILQVPAHERYAPTTLPINGENG